MKKTIPQFIQSAVGNFILQLNVVNSKVLSLVSVIVILIFTWAYLSWNTISDNISDLFTYFAKDENTELRILFFPLAPTNSAYEEMMYDELMTMEANDTFLINVKRLKANFPESVEKAKKIAQRKNADLIVWGKYEEIDNGLFRIISLYNLVNEELNSLPLSEGQSELLLDYRNSDFSNGTLPSALKESISWLSGVIAYNSNDINLAAFHFNDIDVSELISKKSVQEISDLAVMLLDLNQVANAKLLQEKAIQLLETELNLFPDNYILAKNYTNLGQIHYRIGEPDSVKYFIHKSNELLVDDERNKAYELQIINYSVLISFLATHDSKNVDQLCELGNLAICLAWEHDEISNLVKSSAYGDQALCFQAIEEHDSSLTYFRTAIDWNLSIEPKDFSRLSMFYNNYSAILSSINEYAAACNYIDTSIYYSKKFLLPTNPMLGNRYNNAATYLYYSKRYNEALKFVDSAIVIGELPINKEGEAERLYQYYSNKALILESLGDLHKSLVWHRKASEMLEKVYGEKYHEILKLNLANTYINMGIKYKDEVFIDSASYLLENAIQDFDLSIAENIKYKSYAEHTLSYALYIKYSLFNKGQEYLVTADSLIDRSIAVKKGFEGDNHIGVSYLLKTKISYALENYYNVEEYSVLALNEYRPNFPNGSSDIDTLNYFLNKAKALK